MSWIVVLNVICMFTLLAASNKHRTCWSGECEGCHGPGPRICVAALACLKNRQVVRSTVYFNMEEQKYVYTTNINQGLINTLKIVILMIIIACYNQISNIWCVLLLQARGPNKQRAFAARVRQPRKKTWQKQKGFRHVWLTHAFIECTCHTFSYHAIGILFENLYLLCFPHPLCHPSIPHSSFCCPSFCLW